MVKTAMAIGIALLMLGVPGCDGTASGDVPRRAAAAAARSPAEASVARPRPVPRLVDVGAGKCIPCKAMAPILEQLRADYAGRMEVVFVDVWKDPAAGEPFAIRVIPTQIFYGADGRELARHEGFMSREEILARWKGLGVEL
jgi:thioredoxin 1